MGSIVLLGISSACCWTSSVGRDTRSSEDMVKLLTTYDRIDSDSRVTIYFYAGLLHRAIKSLGLRSVKDGGQFSVC